MDTKPRKVLFIHAARDASPEYGVHYTLLRHATPAKIDGYFVCQKDRNGAGQAQRYGHTGGRITYFDFGRDLSIRPRPSRTRRLLWMAKALPGGVSLLRRILREVRPDLIYTSQQVLDVHLARLVQGAYGIPHVAHLHYPVGPWLGRATVRLLRSTRRLLAVSEFVRRTAIAAGVPARAIATIPNSLDPVAIETHSPRGSIRTRHGIDARAPLVVSVGRLDPTKGHAELIAAFADVARSLPDARLLICGESMQASDYRGRLEAIAERLRVRSSIVFAGHIQDIGSAYVDADVFALAAPEEAFGLAYLEAMAFGLPIVACNTGATPEVVRHGRTGLLSAPGDVAGLASHLRLLLEDHNLSRRLGEAGREHVTQTFAPGPISDAWAALLNDQAATG